MTDRTEAMDNLIAQDADLIDTNDKDSAMLLPCPFCGGVQIEAFHHIDRGWGASWHVECVAEECGNSTCHHDTEATAIAAWNKRQPTQSDALREENERLLEALRDAAGMIGGPDDFTGLRDSDTVEHIITVPIGAVKKFRAALQEQSK